MSQSNLINFFDVDYARPQTQTAQSAIQNAAYQVDLLTLPLPEDGAEKQTALRKLLEAMDAVKRIR